MTDELRPEDVAVERTLRAEPRPRADAAFRAELRAAFASGFERARPAGRHAGRDAGRDRRPWIVGAVAAAALVALTLLVVVQDAPELRFVPIASEGGARAAALAADLNAGRTSTVAEVALEVRTTEGLHVRALPGAIVAGKVGVATLELTVRAGEILVWTPRDYAGAPLVVETRDTHIAMTGTAFSILVDNALTCVCVLRGAVSVGAQTVGAQERCIAFASGAAPRCEAFGAPQSPLGAGEEPHLAPLRDWTRERESPGSAR